MRTQEVDPRSGLPGLVTRSVSVAGADQRRGRAGREAPGVCYRMWSPTEDELRRPADPPGITTGDLSALLLQTLSWGVTDPTELAWLDPPPAGALDRAADLLVELGALGADGRLTPTGRRTAEVGFHPRLGAIVAAAEPGGRGDPGRGVLGAEVLAVLDAGGAGVSEVAEGVRALRSGAGHPELRRAHRQWARRLGARARAGPGGPSEDLERDVAILVLAGFADRLARRRPGRRDVYHLRHAGEVELHRAAAGLGVHEWIVAVDVDARSGSGRPGVVHLGAGVPAGVVDDLLDREEAAGRLTERREVEWDPSTGSVTSVSVRRLGAVAVSERRERGADPAALGAAAAEVVGREGPGILGAWAATAGERARIAFLRATGAPRGRPGTEDWPDLDEEALRATAQLWVPPLVMSSATRDRFAPDGPALLAAVTGGLDWEDRRVLDAEAPTHWHPPSGRQIPLRYGEVDGQPGSVLLATRLQALLGVDEHPRIGPRHIPVAVELLSPAGRPVQRTMDLPGFWRGTYAQVRAEMRGRYPKHDWPQRPWEAPAGR